MATGFAIVLAPIVLAAGALMLWGQRGGPGAAFYAGLTIVALPVLWGGSNYLGGMAGKLGRARGRAMYGKFEDPVMTRLARAIDAGDTTKVAEYLAVGPIDFGARDRRDRTILGHAITRVLSSESRDGQLEAVRLLIQAGAPVKDGLIAPAPTPGEPEAHLTLISVIGGAGERTRALLELLLSSGLSPDGVDMDGRPVIFSTYLDLPELEILTRHGVNLNALDPRTDRLGQSALMNAVTMSEWEMAKFLLANGVDPDIRAADGATVDSILDDNDDAEGVKELRRLIAARRAGSAGR